MKKKKSKLTLILVILSAILLLIMVTLSFFNFLESIYNKTTIYEEICETTESCSYNCGDTAYALRFCDFDAVIVNKRRCERNIDYIKSCEKQEVDNIEMLIDCSTQNNITVCGKKIIYKTAINQEWLDENAECIVNGEKCRIYNTKEDCEKYFDWIGCCVAKDYNCQEYKYKNYIVEVLR